MKFYSYLIIFYYHLCNKYHVSKGFSTENIRLSLSNKKALLCETYEESDLIIMNKR